MCNAIETNPREKGVPKLSWSLSATSMVRKNYKRSSEKTIRQNVFPHCFFEAWDCFVNTEMLKFFVLTWSEVIKFFSVSVYVQRFWTENNSPLFSRKTVPTLDGELLLFCSLNKGTEKLACRWGKWHWWIKHLYSKFNRSFLIHDIENYGNVSFGLCWFR